MGWFSFIAYRKAVPVGRCSTVQRLSRFRLLTINLVLGERTFIKYGKVVTLNLICFRGNFISFHINLDFDKSFNKYLGIYFSFLNYFNNDLTSSKYFNF